MSSSDEEYVLVGEESAVDSDAAELVEESAGEKAESDKEKVSREEEASKRSESGEEKVGDDKEASRR